MRRRVAILFALTACWGSAPKSEPLVDPTPLSRPAQRPPEGDDFVSGRVLKSYSSEEGTIVDLDRGSEHGVTDTWEPTLIDGRGRSTDDREGRLLVLHEQRAVVALPHTPRAVAQAGWVRLQRPVVVVVVPQSAAPITPPVVLQGPLRARVIGISVVGTGLEAVAGVGAMQGVTSTMQARLVDQAGRSPTGVTATIVRVERNLTRLRLVGATADQVTSRWSALEFTP